MKTFRRLLGLFAASLLVVCSSVMSLADDERAGYQGIPVRNGLNRGIVEQEDSSATRRYPRLARRPNETDIAQPASDGYPNRDHAGYGGIPQRGSSASQTQPEKKTAVSKAENAGYRGIPQPVAKNGKERQPRNTFAGQQTSGLVNAK